MTASSDPSSSALPEVDFGFERVSATEKRRRVRGVFDSVASKYDIMNDVMSMGVHRIWKTIAADTVNPQPGEVILDLAAGTGDLSRALVKRSQQRAKGRGETGSAELVACDLTPAMLKAGLERGDGDHIVWVAGDGLKLPFADNSFDAALISFGIRNVVDIPTCLAELHRVLKPMGRFVCLEFSQPAAFLRPAYDAYSFNLLPKLGKIIAQDEASYRYLAESIRKFPTQDVFAEMMRTAGFKQVSYDNLTGGIAALHKGWK